MDRRSQLRRYKPLQLRGWRKCGGAIFVLLILLAPGCLAQSTTVSGSKVMQGGSIMASGQWCFGATCLTVTNGAFTGSVTTGTAAVTVVNSSSATILTLGSVTISGATYSWDGYTVPIGESYSGAGNPYLACQLAAQYTQTDASDRVWNCISQAGVLTWSGSGNAPAVGPGNVSGYGTPSSLKAVVPTIYSQADANATWAVTGAPGSVSSSWYETSGSGSFTQLTQDATSTSTGGTTTVIGLKTIPFCTGFAPTNGENLQYTTGSSPDPCWTAAGGGSGTVTGFSAGNLSPLFTTSVATSTTTPVLSFSLSNAAQGSVYAGPASGGAGPPSFQTAPAISAANMTSFPTLNQNTTGTAANVTATSNSTLTTLSALSLPYSQLTGTPTVPTSTNWPNAGACGTNDYVDTLTNGAAPTCAQVQYSQLGGTIPTWNQNTTGYAANLAGGSLGSLPYQSAANTTIFIASPTTSGHTFVPAWQPSGSAVAPAALDLATYLASPPAIGATAANAATFTNLTVTGTCTGCGSGISGIDANGSAVTPSSGIVNFVAGTNITLGVSGNAITITSSATGATAFSALTSATNNSATMQVGSGAVLEPTASTPGTISANQVYSCATAGLATTTSGGALGCEAVPTWNQNTTGYAAGIAGGAANDLLYQTGSNATGFISAADNAVLVTSSLGVPSESTTLPSGLSATNLTLTTPALGTPASGVITNLTGTCASCTANSAGSVANALTMNNGGSGAASGTTYNGSASETISYNTIGASPLAGSTSLVTVGTVTTGTWHGGLIGSVYGGTGVDNSATLTLGTSNQNWATLGTGIVKNTTTTGAISDAAASDVIALWSGTCNSSTWLNGAGTCSAPSGSGTVNSGTEYEIGVYATTGTAISGDGLLTENGTTFTYTGTGGITASDGPVTAASDGVHAGSVTLVGNTTNPTIPANQFAWLGFSSASATAYGLQPSNTAPTANQLMLFPAPTSSVSQFAWVNDYTTVNGTNCALGGTCTVTANNPNALTMNNGGSGAASGSTYNGGSAVTISYNSIGAAPTASPTFTGTVTMPLSTGGLVTTTSGGVLNSEASATIPQGGTGAATAAAALINLFPTATRVGDIIYCSTYSGGACTAWSLLAGNNSGTEVLEENSSGIPAWAATAGFGTVTSVTIAGTANQIATSGTCTITTTGTCTLSIPAALDLGASGTLGSVTMGNATSGTITLEPATGALGTITEYLPISSGDTLAGIAATQTLTNKSIAGSEINSGLVATTYGGTGNGSLTFPSGTATIPQTVASGTAAMGTSAISSGSCATVVTVAATNVASTDVLTVSFNSDPTAVTGYGASATGAVLTIYPYPTSGDVNFKVCNSTANSITPGSLTLNWRVTR